MATTTAARAERSRTPRAPVPAVGVQPEAVPAATSPRPVTEAIVREAVRGALERETTDVGALVDQYLGPIHWIPRGERVAGAYRGALWDDLRPSEAERLAELAGSVYDLEESIERMITDAVVAAALAFAAEFPEAPRAGSAS